MDERFRRQITTDSNFCSRPCSSIGAFLSSSKGAKIAIHGLDGGPNHLGGSELTTGFHQNNIKYTVVRAAAHYA